NSTSLQMRAAVNQRVFDCPAAGGFLISDAQADLAEFFDEDEYVSFQSLDDLQDKVHYYRENSAARKELIRRAQGRIRAHHTHAHRLKDLEGYLKARFAG
ncbi:MAG: glycosyltransferase, partial [Candidatus Hydrogenedentes bacterium]|nr:glycosyltransferase [Candidatus Hydrogenedentota bacterium]